ncbi:MAG: hypothetical protein ACAH88_20245 [Roseimicrobium sp.]
MSRRTKLIILAIFLVLLAIPAAYVICTWHPENPLRFHPVEQVEIEPLGVAKDRVFAVSVENTSHAPVRLVLAFPSWRSRIHEGREDLGVIRPSYQEHDFRSDKEYLLIPPRTSRRCTVRVQLEDVTSFPSTETGMQTSYYWYSDTRGHLVDACDWLREHAPRALHSVIPTFYLHGDETQLQSFLPEAIFGADRTPMEPLRP